MSVALQLTLDAGTSTADAAAQIARARTAVEEGRLQLAREEVGRAIRSLEWLDDRLAVELLGIKLTEPPKSS